MAYYRNLTDMDCPGLLWMTFIDDFHGQFSMMTVMDDFTKFSWLKLFLHIVYGQTDRLKLVLVKSLSRLKN